MMIVHDEVVQPGPGKILLEFDEEILEPGGQIIFDSVDQDMYADPEVISKVEDVLKKFNIDCRFVHHYTLLALHPVTLKSAFSDFDEFFKEIKGLEELFELSEDAKNDKLSNGVLKFQSDNGEKSAKVEQNVHLTDFLSKFELPKNRVAPVYVMKGLKAVVSLQKQKSAKLDGIDVEKLLRKFGFNDVKARRIGVFILTMFALEHGHMPGDITGEYRSGLLARFIRDLFLASNFMDGDDDKTALKQLIYKDLASDRMSGIFG